MADAVVGRTSVNRTTAVACTVDTVHVPAIGAGTRPVYRLRALDGRLRPSVNIAVGLNVPEPWYHGHHRPVGGYCFPYGQR